MLALDLLFPSCPGMILYNGQTKTTGADFMSFGLVGGRPEFRYIKSQSNLKDTKLCLKLDLTLGF